MAMTSVTVRVDDETKRAASTLAEDFGFDLSSVTRAFYKQMVREQRIPLNLEYPSPNQESLDSIRDAEAIIGEGRGGYASADEMFTAMGIDQC